MTHSGLSRPPASETFQILTKRGERLREMSARFPWPKNVWMGVSIEDARVVNRAVDLASVPASVRFLSCEPLIGPLESLPLENIDWVIVGGESGPRSREMKASWVKSIRHPMQKAESCVFLQAVGRCSKGPYRSINGWAYL